jgi:hypothetical protein
MIMKYLENITNSAPEGLSGLSTNKTPRKKNFNKKIILSSLLFFLLSLILIGIYAVTTINQNLQSDSSIGERRTYAQQNDKDPVKLYTEDLVGLLKNLGIKKFKVPPCSFTDLSPECNVDLTNFKESLVEFSYPSTGVYSFKWKENIAGIPEKSEKDRYELVFNSKIENIYGLGIDYVSGGVAIDDFLDNSFAQGNVSNKYYDNFTNPDAIMARTPIFVIPEKNLIILYIQDEVKQLRLERAENKTEIVMAKKKNSGQFGVGEFIVVTGSNIQETFKNYYTFLNNNDYFFKKPHFKAFGLNWEIYQEMGIFPNNTRIDEAIDQYARKGLILDTLTIGSGFWSYNYGNRALSPMYNSNVSCVQNPVPSNSKCGAPSMEIMEKSNASIFNLEKLYSKLEANNTYLLFGMRHNSRYEYANQFIQKIIAIDPNIQPNDVFMNNSILPYYGYAMGDVAVPLNTKNEKVMSAYIKGLDNAFRVGNASFKGLKEDEMIWYDNKNGRDWHINEKNSFLRSNPTHPISSVEFPQVPNIAESHFADVYRQWDKHWKGDWVSMGSTNYISFGTDAQETNLFFNASNKVDQNILNHGHSLHNQDIIDKAGKDINTSRNGLDKMMQRILAGYVHPNLLKSYNNALWTGTQFVSIGLETDPGAFCTITNINRTTAEEVERDALIFIRDWQWTTFTPVVWQSCGFWHLYDNGQAENYGSYSSHYEIVDLFANKILNEFKEPIMSDRAINTQLLKNYYESASWYGALRKRLQQYSYDMAQEWYQSGVPTLMRPLFINEEWKMDPEVLKLYKTCRFNEDCYPKNGSIIPPEYMYGNALLVRPIMNTRDQNDNNLQVYLPAGNWLSFIKKMPVIKSSGGSSGYINFEANTINSYPVFLREARLLIIGDERNFDKLQAYLYLEPNTNFSEVYRLHDRSFNRDVKSVTRYQGQRIDGKVYLVNLENNKKAEMVADRFDKGYLYANLDAVK